MKPTPVGAKSFFNKLLIKVDLPTPLFPMI